MNKKERLVAAIEHGTVIDHIPADKTYQVASLLGLFDLKTPVKDTRYHRLQLPFSESRKQRYHQGFRQVFY